MDEYTAKLEAENRDLRLLLGALLARADGRVEVTDAEMVRAREATVQVDDVPVKGRRVFTLSIR